MFGDTSDASALSLRSPAEHRQHCAAAYDAMFMSVAEISGQLISVQHAHTHGLCAGFARTFDVILITTCVVLVLHVDIFFRHAQLRKS